MTDTLVQTYEHVAIFVRSDGRFYAIVDGVRIDRARMADIKRMIKKHVEPMAEEAMLYPNFSAGGELKRIKIIGRESAGLTFQYYKPDGSLYPDVKKLMYYDQPYVYDQAKFDELALLNEEWQSLSDRVRAFKDSLVKWVEPGKEKAGGD